MSALPRLSTAELLALARAAPTEPCAACAALVCPGWESVPGGFDGAVLAQVGSLVTDDDEPTLQEHHPHGTHGWSADAPIAPRWFPYNRCGVWQCRHCRRAFLRYTEYGGYYTDERIRAIDPTLITDA